MISVNGLFAAREARQALQNDLNVMLFSDNVSVEDELALKQLAHEKGLLMTRIYTCITIQISLPGYAASAAWKAALCCFI